MNGFNYREIQLVIHKVLAGKQNGVGTQEEDTKTVLLPYCGAVSSQIGRLISKFSFRPVYRPFSKIEHLLITL